VIGVLLLIVFITIDCIVEPKKMRQVNLIGCEQTRVGTLQLLLNALQIGAKEIKDAEIPVNGINLTKFLCNINYTANRIGLF
jgi:hypothetical protein